MSQLDKLHATLVAGNTITGAQALARYGMLRLPARVYDLRQEGFKIITERVRRREDGVLVARYRLASKSRKTRVA